MKLFSSCAWTLSAVVASLSAAPSFGAFSHDYGTEFSQASNPNGVWSYQSALIADPNSAAVNMASPDNCCGGAFWQTTSGDTYSLLGNPIIHPGVSHDSVLGFAFPDALTEDVHAVITLHGEPDSQNGRIVNFWLNDTKITSATVSGAPVGGDVLVQNNTDYSFDFIQSMSPGDKLFIRIDAGSGNNFGDSTNLKATFSSVPEPACCGLLGLATIGLRRRRTA